MANSRRLRSALAAITLLGGLVHLQQFLTEFSIIPIIGPMFLVNTVLSAAVAALLILRSERLWVLAAALLAAGSLGAILISRASGLFGYVSTTFEAPEASAVAFEVTAVLLAAFMLVKKPRLTPAS